MYRIVLILFLIAYMGWYSFYIFQAVHTEFGNQSGFRGKQRFNDNIGNKDYFQLLAFPPIDAVYTWVNGSDPDWVQEKNYYEKIFYDSHNITNESLSDTSTSDNRFRDNDELKCASPIVPSVDTASARWK